MHDTKEPLFTKVVHGLRWSLLSRLVAQGAAWVFTIFSIRLLTPDDYGISSMAGFFVAIVGILFEAGATVVIVQQRIRNRRVLGGISSLLLLIALGTSLLGLATAPLFALYFHQPAVAGVLRAMAISFPLSALGVVPTAVLLQRLDFRRIAFINTFAGVVQGAANVVFASLGFAYWSLIIGILIGVALTTTLATLQVPVPLGGWRALRVAAHRMRSARNIIPQRLTWLYINQLDTFLVARMLGTGPTGNYSIAKSLSHTLLDRLGELSNTVALPSFAARQHDPESWQRAFARLQRLASDLSFPIFWGLAAVGPDLLLLLLGPKWSAVAPVFRIFCLILPLRVSYALLDTVLMSTGHSATAFRNVVTWALVLTPLLVVGAQSSSVAIAAAWAIGFPITLAIALARMARILAVPFADLVRPYWPPALAAAIMWAAVSAAALPLGGLARAWVRLPLEVLLGAAVYALALRLAARERFGDLVGIAGTVVGIKAKTTG
jgi:O-antigen/teichoic acid export membrane protein